MSFLNNLFYLIWSFGFWNGFASGLICVKIFGGMNHTLVG